MKRVRRFIGFINPFRTISRLVLALRNWRRRRFKKLDYVMFSLPSKLPAFPERRNWIQRRVLGDPPLSLMELEWTFERLGDDPRVKGVILYLRGLEMSLADAQTLRDIILRLRERDKRVVCFAQNYSLLSYYVASAADDIILQEGGWLVIPGLYRNMTFIRDALEAVGLQADGVAISPYKSANDLLTRSDISPEVREQMNWLLDSQYSQIVGGIAKDRDVTPEAVHEMIDGALCMDADALEAGYVDVVCNEEKLAKTLGAEHLVPWDKAVKVLIEKWRDKPEKYVVVLPVSGMMVEGESRKPPVDIPIPVLGEERMGSITVVQQVRNLMQDERAAAVVLYIDSGGGSAAASEAMASALDELAKDRPLVVYMNGVAASGGYYIATPAHWIVAQPGTITGSIGVLTLKLVNSEMLKKIRFNAVEFLRGANASMFSPSAPFTNEQRLQMQQAIRHSYKQFVGRVAYSRKMKVDAVDAAGGGRVWTGEQAIGLDLVDQLGGLYEAVEKARRLADLPDESPVAVFKSKGRPLAPQLAEQTNPAAALQYMRENLEMICDSKAQLLTPMRWE